MKRRSFLALLAATPAALLAPELEPVAEVVKQVAAPAVREPDHGGYTDNQFASVGHSWSGLMDADAGSPTSSWAFIESSLSGQA